MTKTTNEMIFATLKTRADKPAKFADKLRDMGYTVENEAWNYSHTERVARDYWAVNGLEVDKFEGETARLSLGRGQYVERFDRIKLIDFEGYFAKLDERKAKWERFTAHGFIEQTHQWDKRQVTFWVDRKRKVETRRVHHIIDRNHEVDRYKMLKAASKGGTVWGDHFCDHLKYKVREVEDAERKLAEAQRELERAKAALAKAEADMAEDEAKLNEFLEARGIRGEVA